MVTPLDLIVYTIKSVIMNVILSRPRGRIKKVLFVEKCPHKMPKDVTVTFPKKYYFEPAKKT